MPGLMEGVGSDDAPQPVAGSQPGEAVISSSGGSDTGGGARGGGEAVSTSSGGSDTGEGAGGAGRPRVSSTASSGGGGDKADIPSEREERVNVILNAVGGGMQYALPTNKNKVKVKATEPLWILTRHLRDRLKLDAQTPLFLFINNAFSPGLEETFGELLACFGIRGALYINYGVQEVYG